MLDDCVAAGAYYADRPSCAALHEYGSRLALRRERDEIWKAARLELLAALLNSGLWRQ